MSDTRALERHIEAQKLAATLIADEPPPAAAKAATRAALAEPASAASAKATTATTETSAATPTPRSGGVASPTTTTRLDLDVGAEMEADDAVGQGDADETSRRTAKRRPAGPSRDRIAANDDAPSIGGLIYALNQKPSGRPFYYAGVVSAVWAGLCLVFGSALVFGEIKASTGVLELLAKPGFLPFVAAIISPIALAWFLALLAWRTEELHLRSTAMTEVAVRLAEPDRMAEQHVASLGQAVRRQASFMNDAVERALGRAGELEALVHSEVASLERSYQENEQRIRGLIQELSSERHSLLSTGEHFQLTLRALGNEVPALVEKLAVQQERLAGLVEGAGENLVTLEANLARQTGRLETALGSQAQRLETTLSGQTLLLENTFDQRSEQFNSVLGAYTQALGSALDQRANEMQRVLTDQSQTLEATLQSRGDAIQTVLATYTEGLGGALENRTELVRQMLDDHSRTHTDQLAVVDNAINERTQMLQTILQEYATTLDTTLAQRAELLDQQIIERSQALEAAFAERLAAFDDSVLRSTMAIDSTVGESARALTNALETHAVNLSQTMHQQAANIDESLMQGISAVRRTSENVSRQSLKAIEGLASQADLLKNVSENLLGQINAVTNRFETQGQAIMRSANALETANYKIDKTLENRATALNETLSRMSGRADELGRLVQDYSQNLEGSMSEAQSRARLLTQDLARDAQERSTATLAELARLKQDASREADRTLDQLRSEFANVSREISERLGTMTNEFTSASSEVRERAAIAASELQSEQMRLREQLERLPGATRESAEAMRRALQDQLRALDQLTHLSRRTGEERSISRPVEAHATYVRPPTGQRGPTTPLPRAPNSAQGGDHATTASGSAPVAPPPREDRARALSSLTSSLQQELGQRQPRPMPQRSGGTTRPATPPQAAGQPVPHAGSQTPPSQPPQAAPVPAQPRANAPATTPAVAGAATAAGAAAYPPQTARDGWKLGDLLARASTEATSPDAAQDAPFDPRAAAQSLDPSTAAAIWGRLRTGQRNFMVRSIYSDAKRPMFDATAQQYATNPAFRQNLDTFVAEFDALLRDCDARDPSGQAALEQIVGDTGRVYLFLSHASGRLG